MSNLKGCVTAPGHLVDRFHSMLSGIRYYFLTNTALDVQGQKLSRKSLKQI